jgi:hypothetical protein
MTPGSVPARSSQVSAGSVIRVYVLPGPVVFDFVVAAVLIPLGAWLALTQAVPAHTTRQARLPRVVIGLIAAVAGCVGGIYGIGGGSILAPILVADGQPPSQVAPAALSSTFLTSLAGVDMTDLLRRIAASSGTSPAGSACRAGLGRCARRNCSDACCAAPRSDRPNRKSRCWTTSPWSPATPRSAARARQRSAPPSLR